MDTSCHSGYNLRHHGDAKDVCLDVEQLSTVSASSSIVTNAAETDDVIEQHEQTTSSNSDNTVFKFKPLSLKLARTMCNKCDVDFEKQDGQRPKVSGYLGAVCKTESIVKDGNSFFRAITQVISGSQKCHLMIRRVVIKHMEKDAGDLIKLVGNNYMSMPDYITKSQMKYVGHRETWQQFCCKSKVSDEGIYLKQCEGNHFEQVVCVQNKDQLVCFELCKEDTSETQYMCTRNVKLETDSTSPSCVNVKYCFTTYLKTKRYLQNTRAYHLNDLYRQKVMERSVKKYNENVSHRQMVKDQSKDKYNRNMVHRQMVKEQSKNKYKANIAHRLMVKDRSRVKYKANIAHRLMVKDRSRVKYKANIAHRLIVKDRSTVKYKDNMDHRQNVKAMSFRKYRLNPLHKQNVKALSTKKYHGSHDHQVSVIASNKRKRLENKVKSEELDFVMEHFAKKVKDGPDFVCCVCHRMLFCHQVLHCKRDDYNKSAAMAGLAEKCISDKYLHKCSADCVLPCRLMDTPRSQLWICHTCHGKINKGVLPPECAMNSMVVEPIPAELACLNSLEQHLIALHIPFMKMLALPKGGQNGVHGPVTCVPANIVQTSN